MLREGDFRFRQRYLRLFINRIDASKDELVVTGPTQLLAGAAADPSVLQKEGVHAFMQVWRPRRDLNARPPD